MEELIRIYYHEHFPYDDIVQWIGNDWFQHLEVAYNVEVNKISTVVPMRRWQFFPAKTMAIRSSVDPIRLSELAEG